MTGHVFLTGEKRVGKSTLLKKVLAGFSGSIGGFFTVRTNAFLEGRYSVHLFAPGEETKPDEGNLLFVCGEPNGNSTESFERLGCRALESVRGSSLIVMDELGPHEAEAVRFRRAVLKLLDGDTPILGVLQAPAERFWPEIVKHPGAEIIEITKSNRDSEALLQHILAAISG